MRAVFWVSALFIVYVYVGYPALLALWLRVRRALGRDILGARVLPMNREHGNRYSSVAAPGITVSPSAT